jgi:hypothetical protein
MIKMGSGLGKCTAAEVPNTKECTMRMVIHPDLGWGTSRGVDCYSESRVAIRYFVPKYRTSLTLIVLLDSVLEEVL